MNSKLKQKNSIKKHASFNRKEKIVPLQSFKNRKKSWQIDITFIQKTHTHRRALARIEMSRKTQQIELCNFCFTQNTHVKRPVHPHNKCLTCFVFLLVVVAVVVVGWLLMVA